MEQTLMDKLTILADSAKYDVACTSSGASRTARAGILGSCYAPGCCHAFTADGRCVSLLKVLMTNCCAFDCSYCVNRKSNDVPRATFTPRELAELTIGFYRRNYIEGLFLSSGITHNPNYTMSQLVETVYLLREKYHFGGYIHLKAIPGAAADLIEAAGMYADRMSVNLELPTADGLALLAPHKSRKTILTPMRQIQNGIYKSRELPLIDNKTASLPGSTTDNTPDNSDSNFYNNRISTADRFHAPGIISGSSTRNLSTVRPVNNSFVPAGQSTQMIIGATPESDYHIVTIAEALYKQYDLKRVYYSAFVNVNNDDTLPIQNDSSDVPLLREHRLYQADWLMRFYGFKSAELLSPEKPNFNIFIDPKCDWAIRHLEHFPVEINRADYYTLLRVPGIGVNSARRIVRARRSAKLDFNDLKKIGVVLKRAIYFITCQGHMMYTNMHIEQNFITNNLISSEQRKNYEISSHDTYRQMSLFDDYNIKSGV